jgi:putative transposase
MNKYRFREYYKRNLPHIQMNDGIYAITFRLAFSLPKEFITKMKLDKEQFDNTVKKISSDELNSFKNEFSKKYYTYFDNFIGKYNASHEWLKNKDCAQTVFKSIQYWNKKRYELYSFCIMSNHVHLLIKPLFETSDYCFPLSKILYSIKRHTAGKCNIILNRKGQFWHHESYDHQIRNVDDFYYQLHYILQNPVKAKLVKDWKDWEFCYLNLTTLKNTSNF